MPRDSNDGAGTVALEFEIADNKSLVVTTGFVLVAW